MIHLIVSMTPTGVIGRQGDQPWHIKEDLANFKKVTWGHALIVGERTFKTPALNKPLPGRELIVLSPKFTPPSGVEVARNLPEALTRAHTYSSEIFMIGGQSVYEQTLPLADYLHISTLKEEVSGNVYFPPYDQTEWEKVEEKEFAQFTYAKYKRKNASKA